jgi:chloramphenicol 3-O-phosphotransferase
MAQTADTYVEAGVVAIAQDVIVGPILSDVVGMIRTRPLALVVLTPSVDVIELREAARAKSGYHGFTPHELDAALRADTPRLGLWIDSSSQTAAQTVDEILDRTGTEALV